jgi:hypothetical protein
MSPDQAIPQWVTAGLICEMKAIAAHRKGRVRGQSAHAARLYKGYQQKQYGQTEQLSL